MEEIELVPAAAGISSSRLRSPRLLVALLSILATLTAAPLLNTARHSFAQPARASHALTTAAPRALPVQFEQNQGQADPSVRFLAPEPGGTLFLTDNEFVLSLNGQSGSSTATPSASAAGDTGHRPVPAVPAPQALVHMRLDGGSATPRMDGLDPLATSRNYMVGSRSQWHLGVPSFARVAYRSVYPGIDLVYHGETGGAEYDFDVAPGADPHAIVLSFSGQHSLRLDASGNLVLETAAGTLTQQRPLIYQQINGARHDIAGGFHLLGDGRVAFDVGAYDATRPLVVDPVIAYSTYIGGTTMSGNNEVTDITVDSAGNVYAAGGTQEADFPVTTQFGPRNTTQNAYVLKLNAAGSMVTWSTVFGGSNTQGEDAKGVAVDPSGNVWVTGFTHSTDFPTTPTAFKPVRTCQIASCPDATAFVTEFNSLGGIILYSTYLGGAGRPSGSGFDQSDLGVAIATDAGGKIYVGGQTGSPDFPTTTGAFQSTFPGTTPKTNGFVSKLDGSQAGTASLVYSTFLGGSSTLTDAPQALTVDASGNAWVAGGAQSPDFPTTAGAFQSTNNGPASTNGGDGFLTGLNAAGSGLVYSTFLGGTNTDSINGLALGPSGSLYLAGTTASSGFPTTAGAFSRIFHGGSSAAEGTDGTFSVLSPGGRGAADLTYSTYLGGTGDDEEDAVVADGSGNAYIYGGTKSSDWALLNPVQGVWGGQNLAFQYNSDLTITELHPGGAGAADLVFSTYLGGTADDISAGGIARSSQGAIYIAGREIPPLGTPQGALPLPYPTTRGAFLETWTTSPEPGFVTKLDLSGTTGLLAVPGSNGSLYTKSDANPYVSLGGVLVAAPTVVAVPGAAGALPTPLFIAVGSDHNLYVRSLTQGWRTLSSSPVYCIDTAGATVTTSNGTSTLTVACQGSDHGLWYAQGSVSAASLPTVSGWQGLGGTLTYGPAVTTVNGALTFMVVGGNGAVYSRTTTSGYTATGWSCIGHVALASYRGNAYFACQGGDHALWYSVNPGSGWVQVQSAGGVIADSPAIVATPAEVIVYVEGSNRAVYHVTLSPGGGPTTPWVYDGGSIQFGPGATTLTP